MRLVRFAVSIAVLVLLVIIYMLIHNKKHIVQIGPLTFEVRNSSTYLSLPYMKPEGVDRVYSPDNFKIKILSLNFDKGRTKIRPRRQLFISDEMYSKIRTIQVKSLKSECKLEMMLTSFSHKKPREYLVYRSYALDKRYPSLYRIPYGTEKLNLTYSIVFPSERGKYGNRPYVDNAIYSAEINLIYETL